MTFRQKAYRAMSTVAKRVGLGPFVIAYREARLPEAVKRDRLDMDHLRTMIGFWLGEDSNCVDVGANKGAFLRMVEGRAPRGTHHAFEPIPHLAQALREQFPRVVVHELAASDRSGDVEFTLVDTNQGYSGITDTLHPLPSGWKSRTTSVRTARLDDVLPIDYQPDFMKVDVEGAELAVLRGARRVLERRPVLFVEHVEGGASGELHRLLTGYGYAVYDVDGGGPYAEDEFLDVVRAGKLWNFVCLGPSHRTTRPRR